MINSETTLEELAYIVCTGLKNHQIDAVLTGGAAVSIYTENKYQSFDLDFISYKSHKEIATAMKSLGFSQKNRYFVHPETKYFVEFPPGPISLGAEFVKKWALLKKGDRLLQILTPTQSVKDRLASFFHWDDKESLNQAIWIFQNQEVDLEDIKRWAKNEKSEEKLKFFLDKISA